MLTSSENTLQRFSDCKRAAADASADQTFTFQIIPGLVVTVYACTTFTLDDGTQPNPFPLIAIDIPLDRLPDMMPTTNMLNPSIVVFQPANAVASQPEAVNFPNSFGYAPVLMLLL